MADLQEIVKDVVDLASRISGAITTAAISEMHMREGARTFLMTWREVDGKLSRLVKALKPNNNVPPLTNWDVEEPVATDLWRAILHLGEAEYFALDVLLAAMNLRCKKGVIFPKTLDRYREYLLLVFSEELSKKHGSLETNVSAFDQTCALTQLVCTLSVQLKFANGSRN
jgi:hypothetical protein